MKKVHLCLVTFGVIIGIVGILHGGAELLRGAELIEAQSAQALPALWPNAEFHTLMQGSPVFTLLTGIPYYVLGLLAISVSITWIVASLTILSGRHGRSGWGLALFALLNVGTFLFGAGQGTPIAVGLPTLIFGTVSVFRTKKRTRTASAAKRLLACFWLFYGLQIFSWVLFFPGLFVLSFYGPIPRALFLFDFWIMPISIIGALLSGLLYDGTVYAAPS